MPANPPTRARHLAWFAVPAMLVYGLSEWIALSRSRLRAHLAGGADWTQSPRKRLR
jgi:hypothetical protein